MQFSVQSIDTSTKPCECLIVLVSSAEKNKPAISNSHFTPLLAPLFKQGDFSGKQNETLLLHNPTALAAERVLFVGVGDNTFTTTTLYTLFKTVSAKILSLPAKQIIFHNLESILGVDAIQVAGLFSQAIIEASYQFNQFKTSPKKTVKLKKITVNSSNKKASILLHKALEKGAAVGEGINTAKELGDLPGNICTPNYLAATARKLAKNHKKVTAQVLNEKQMSELKMGSLLSVSAGTQQPAKLIIINYKGGPKNQKPIVLVGKGVTFDSGGISLKPGAGMDEMKYDMCGAASVVGTLQAAATIELPLNIIGIIPAVENMPGGKATKPGDIVTSMSGQTIEVLNTDAEGRLILCDALTYAERFKPRAIIDIATLTGACVVALGSHATGLFSNSNELTEALLIAGKNAADRAWHMPLWQEYDKQLKSNFADMANIGGGKGGSITAASFLARFTKKQTWAHLDIAGTAWQSGAKKGATGRPVALLLEYLKNQAES